MSWAIRTENLSKCYRIAHADQRLPYRTLREDLMRMAATPWRWLRGAGTRRSEDFWALKDVSLEVKHGEVLGIIGRNGAGKSTLLKILSRITRPTSGTARIRGRVGSLLEVGTGFHPELTGRENIYLCGAVLGMRRREIDREFDAIVDFAEIEQFLDTPVKRYSSGMYVRLGFAIAAHLEPEVLIVDEVLAVGDAAFQKKCLGKMSDVARSDRTVLFVSHNMGAVQKLCQRAVLLDNGQVAQSGESRSVVQAYFASSAHSSAEWTRDPPGPSDLAHFRSLMLCDAEGRPCPHPTSAGQVGVDIEFCVPTPIRGLLVAVLLCSEGGAALFSTSPQDAKCSVPEEPGLYHTRLLFPAAFLMPARYSLVLSLYTKTDLHDQLDNALAFEVGEADSLANSLGHRRMGELQVQCDWTPIVKADSVSSSPCATGAAVHSTPTVP